MNSPTPPTVTNRSPRRRVLLRWLSWGLLVSGVLCVLVAVGTLTEGRVYQGLARRHLAQAGPPVTAPVEAILDPGSALGTIEIPEAGIDAVILEGVDPAALRRGVGHFPATGLPGTSGNFALAAHRDTFFRGLRHLQVGHRVQITTPQGTFIYRIEHTRIVEPTAIEILDDQAVPTLTLITCYPFGYLGSAPQRFVATGRLEL